MAEYLFSYGTLQNVETQIQLFGRKLQGWPDALAGYKVETIEIKDEAFLQKGEDKFQKTLVYTNNESDSINGTRLQFTTEELIQADKYEPKNYKRIKATLQSGNEAWIYIAMNSKNNE